MCKTRRDIRNFRNLLIDESAYSKVADIFDRNKLHIYLAYNIMLHAKACEKNGDVKSVEHALNYLQKFIAANPHLVKERASIKLIKKSRKAKRIQEYAIYDIVRYIRDKSPQKRA